MKRTFIQSEHFKTEMDSRPDGQEILKSVEEEILKNPESGDLVSGTGGVRKIRIADPSRGKGKRGGLRILYLDLPDRDHTHLLVAYDKDQADDLSPDGKKMIRQIVLEIKRSKR